MPRKTKTPDPFRNPSEFRAPSRVVLELPEVEPHEQSAWVSRCMTGLTSYTTRAGVHVREQVEVEGHDHDKALAALEAELLLRLADVRRLRIESKEG